MLDEGDTTCVSKTKTSPRRNGAVSREQCELPVLRKKRSRQKVSPNKTQKRSKPSYSPDQQTGKIRGKKSSIQDVIEDVVNQANNTENDVLDKGIVSIKNNSIDDVIEDVVKQAYGDENDVLDKGIVNVIVRDIFLDETLVNKYKILPKSRIKSLSKQNKISESTTKTPENLQIEFQTSQVEVQDNHIEDVRNGEENSKDVINENLTTSPSKSECSLPSSISAMSPKLNITNEEQGSKVQVNNFPSAKPFNITINVGVNNKSRKVEFCGQQPVDTVISPTNFSVESDSASCQRSIIDDNESMPVLQFYSGDWFFDSSEENLYTISTRENIFKDAVLSSSPLYTNSLSADLSPRSNTSKGSGLDNNSDKTVPSENPTFQFTKPLLPPAKRPPTRKKTTFSSSSCSHSSTDSLSITDKSCQPSSPLEDFTSSSVGNDEADDAISLYSHWSIRTTDFQTKSTSSKSAEVTTTTKEYQKSRPNTTTSNKFLDSSSKTIENIRNLTDTVQKPSIVQWLNNGQYETPQHADFKQIPDVFKGLCYYYYTTGYCYNKGCKRKHSIHKYLHQKLTFLDYEQIMDAYTYAKTRPKLFHFMIHSFVVTFVRLNSITELVNMTSDVISESNTKNIDYVKTIIQALVSTGWSFAKCIEEIITAQEIKDLNLSNVLLPIVFAETQDLCTNWYLVRKLCSYRNFFPIDQDLMNELMFTCFDQQNLELSIKVVNDIFMDGYADLNSINELLFNRFISFLQLNNLMHEVNVLTQKTKTNFKIVSTFSKCNPVWLEEPPCMNSTPNECSNLKNIEFENRNYHFKLPSQHPNLDVPNGNLPSTTNLQWKSVQNPQSLIPKEWPENVFESNTHTSGEHFVYNDYSRGDDGILESDLEEESITSKKSSISREDDFASLVLEESPNSSVSGKNLESSEKTLSECDIKILSEMIAQNNCDGLITMYNKYKNSQYHNAFVTNIIGFLKQKPKSLIYNVIANLINGLEEMNSHFIYINNAEPTLYLLAINIIALLKQIRAFHEAALLLVKFNDNLNNLLQVQWFRSIQRHRLSDIGKYLYMCQIFMRGNHLEESFKLLKSAELKLLQPSSTWTLKHNDTFDTEFRNNVVNEFIDIALKSNLKIAKDIILHLISSKDNVTEIDLWKYLDELVLALLNGDALHLNDLMLILPNILQGWYKYLRKANMRGLLVKLTSAKIPEKLLLTLYDKCLKQNMYEKLKGNETTITLKTDMTLEEIFVTVRYYLYRLVLNNYEIQEITFIIKMPNQLSGQPQILINSDCRMKEAQERILIVLARCFPTAIVAKVIGVSRIVIRSDQLKYCVDYYKKANSLANSIWVRQSAVEQLAICDTVPDSFNFKACTT